MMEQPWMTVQAQMHDHVMTLTGISAKKFYWDAKTLVDAFAQVAEYYQMDKFSASADIYNFEIEALGAKMIYGNNSMPTIDFREPDCSLPWIASSLPERRKMDWRRAVSAAPSVWQSGCVAIRHSLRI
jgi:hypothetical protein